MPVSLYKALPAVSKAAIDAAIKVAIEKKLLIETRHEDGYRLFGLSDEIIRDLPDNLRPFHIEKLLDWKAVQVKEAADQAKAPSITARAVVPEIVLN